LNISLAKLLKVLKLILNYVDWLKVALKITGNRKLLIYREAIILILYTQVYELEIKKAEEKKKKKEKKNKKDQNEDKNDEKKNEKKDEKKDKKKDEKKNEKNEGENDENNHEILFWY